MRRRSPSLLIASYTVCEMTQFRFKWRCNFVLAPVSYCLKMSHTIRRWNRSLCKFTVCVAALTLNVPWPDRSKTWNSLLYLASLRLISPYCQERIKGSYYMAESASRQDKANLAFWLATRAVKMGLSFPLGIIPALVPHRKSSLFGHVKILYRRDCSVTVAGYLLCSFFHFYWPWLRLTKFQKGTWPISRHVNLTLG